MIKLISDEWIRVVVLFRMKKSEMILHYYYLLFEENLFCLVDVCGCVAFRMYCNASSTSITYRQKQDNNASKQSMASKTIIMHPHHSTTKNSNTRDWR